MPSTSCPRATSACARCEPMKPAAPVTTKRIAGTLAVAQAVSHSRMIGGMQARAWSRGAVTTSAMALAAAAALPAVWWEPLHLDERVMLEYAPHSPPRIVREIFVDRGGAPLQYLVEHVTLSWPAGLAGLRLPS